MLTQLTIFLSTDFSRSLLRKCWRTGREFTSVAEYLYYRVESAIVNEITNCFNNVPLTINDHALKSLLYMIRNVLKRKRGRD
jgi:hypothetical protein